MSSRFNTYPICADKVIFGGNNAGVDGDIHLTAQTEAAHFEFENRLRCVKDVEIKTKITDVDGDNIFEVSGDKTEITHGKKTKFGDTVDFNNQTMQNVAGLNRQLSTTQILSANLSGQSAPNDTLDKELDTLTVATNNNTSRTSGLSVNKIMISNNSGTLQVGDFAQSNVIRNNLSTQQELTSDLNFSAGKGIKYGGNPIAFTDLAGASTLQQAVDTNTAKVGITQAQADAITTNTNKTGITSQQASDITTNNAKVGISTQQASDITTNNAKVGISTQQASDITTNNAKVGITTQQASDITTNNAKVGISTQQASDITTNNAKTGITQAQADAIVANTNKTGITSQQATDITTNNAKVGITTQQATDITTNNAKTGITSQQATDINDNKTNIATITGNYLKKDGSVSMTGGLQTTQIKITDANHNIQKDGNGDMIFNVPSGDIHKFKIDGNTICSIDSGGVDLASGKEFSINGTTLSTTDNSKLPLAGGTMTGALNLSTLTENEHLKLDGSKNVVSSTLQVSDISNNNTLVKTSGAQTIADVKTFSSIPKLPTSLSGSGQFLRVNASTGAIEKATPTDTNTQYDSTDFVDLTSGQTVAGVKTFSSIPNVPVSLGTSGHFLRVNSSTGAIESAQPPDNNTQYDSTDFVDLTSGQTVAGVKTFSNIPKLPTSLSGSGQFLRVNASTGAIEKATPTDTNTQYDSTDFVDLTSTQSIGGQKSFTIAPKLPTSLGGSNQFLRINTTTGAIEKATPVFTDDDSAFVNITGTQSIGGNKTFTNDLVCTGKIFCGTGDQHGLYFGNDDSKPVLKSFGNNLIIETADSTKFINFKTKQGGGGSTLNSFKINDTFAEVCTGYKLRLTDGTAGRFVKLDSNRDMQTADIALTDLPSGVVKESSTNIFTGANTFLSNAIFSYYPTTDLIINRDAKIMTHQIAFNALVSGTDVEYCVKQGCLFKTGTQTITGVKTFHGSTLKITGGAVPSSSGFSSGVLGITSAGFAELKLLSDGDFPNNPTLTGDLTVGGNITIGDNNGDGLYFGSDAKPKMFQYADNLIIETGRSANSVIFKTFQASTTATTNSVEIKDDEMIIDDGYTLQVDGTLKLPTSLGGTDKFLRVNSSTGVVEGSEVFPLVGQANADVLMRFGAGGVNNNTTIWELNATDGTTDAYGFKLKYNGASSGNDNSLSLVSDNQSQGDREAYEVNQDGRMIIKQPFKINVAGGTTGNQMKTDTSAPYRTFTNNAPVWVSFTGNSSTITTASNFTYSGHYVHSTGGWQDCQIAYQKFINPANGQDVYHVYLRGLMVYTGSGSVPTTSSNPLATIADTNLRPAAQRSFTTTAHIQPSVGGNCIRVDVAADGKICLQTGGVSTYVALGGIDYWTN